MVYDPALLEEITNSLLKVKEKIAVAESVTAGCLQNALSQMPNATGFFEGGITAYTPALKINLLKVDPAEAERENCVSPHIAEVMAKNVSELFNTDWSVAITGYAKPVPESGQKLFAYYCIFHRGKILSSEKVNLTETLTPIEAQLKYVDRILNDLAVQIRVYTKNI